MEFGKVKIDAAALAAAATQIGDDLARLAKNGRDETLVGEWNVPQEPPAEVIIDRAVFGAPSRCPKCGGRLQQAFGCLEEGGQRYAVIDPDVAICGDCGTRHRTA